MSFDLTNKNISDTFQNLLQKTGSEGRLFDLVGNQVIDLTVSGTISATTGSFSHTVTTVNTEIVEETQYSASQFSGSVFISGSTPPIGTLEYATALTVLGDISSSNNIYFDGDLYQSGTIFSGGAGFPFSGSAVITGSLEISPVDATEDFFLLKSGSLDALKLNNKGVLQLGGFEIVPTAVSGGMYYDKTDDEFYLGKENN